MALPKYTTVDTVTGCWYVPASLSCGYAQSWIDGKNWRVHRYFYTTAHGAIPEGSHVHHTCRNRACVNPEHLSLLSCSEHAALHMERNHNARRKLTDEDVRAIRAARADGWKLRDIAKEFGVGVPNISMVLSGHRQRHVL